jgi:hypothetical protein
MGSRLAFKVNCGRRGVGFVPLIEQYESNDDEDRGAGKRKAELSKSRRQEGEQQNDRGEDPDHRPY